MKIALKSYCRLLRRQLPFLRKRDWDRAKEQKRQGGGEGKARGFGYSLSVFLGLPHPQSSSLLVPVLSLPLCYHGNPNIEQLLDEIEHDIVNYQNRGLCYLPKTKAEADNIDTRF